MDITNKKVLVVGLGKSGLAAVRLLLHKGASVYVTEIQKISVSLPGVSMELGGHTREFVEGKDLVVLSPGVNPQCPVISWAKEYGIPIVSELELSSWYVSFPLIAITGTNGKSTVTSLVEHIFRCSGKNVIACGNIGLPLSELGLQKENFDAGIVEVSSFQLEYIDNFRPEIAVWLNFSFDHLDHHLSIKTYLEAKLNIFRNQRPGDWAVVYSKEVERVKNKVRGKIAVYDKELWFCSNSNLFLENISAAITIAKIYGISSEDIKSAVDSFQTLPHRLQYVATVGGVDFIDDSKATNVASVIGALDCLANQIVLILGGRDKGGDFTRLKELILKKVNFIIAVGEARDKIWDQLKHTVSVEKVADLESAVVRAFQVAVPGQKILLSPGCSSFDLFKDYKERGDMFQRYVLDLNDKCKSANDKIKSNNKSQFTEVVI